MLKVVQLAVRIMIDSIAYLGVKHFYVHSVILYVRTYLADYAAIGRTGLTGVVLAVSIHIQILFHCEL